MTNEQLLAAIDDLLRTKPSRETINHETEENFSWLGRTVSVISEWKPERSIEVRSKASFLGAPLAVLADRAYRDLMTIIHEARHDLILKTVGPSNVAIAKAMPFHYFDELRKIIETANCDLFFIDAYLDAEFIVNYLPHASAGVTIRLLAREKLNTLLPAANMYIQENAVNLQIRSAAEFHDRYVIVDGQYCYQSGASFKDGAKKSPTTITQITDAFAAVSQTYQELWDNAKPEL